jgi:hypothetical protein
MGQFILPLEAYNLSVVKSVFFPYFFCEVFKIYILKKFFEPSCKLFSDFTPKKMMIIKKEI